MRNRWSLRAPGGFSLFGASFEYIEIFYNRKRRNSSLELRTPIEFEKMHTKHAEHHEPPMNPARFICRRQILCPAGVSLGLGSNLAPLLMNDRGARPLTGRR